MSISVTVSGEDSTSVILSSVSTELVSISGGSSVDVVASSGNSAIITVSSGDPISITGNYSNFVTGQVVRPPEIADFLTENQINTKITAATGNYNTLAANTFYPDSNPSGFITGVDLSDYIRDSETGAFYPDSNPSGFITGVDLSDYVQDSETGSLYAASNPSGFITGVDLSSYTTEDFVTGVSGSLQNQISSNYSDITGIIDTTGSFVLKSETGSFILDSETGAFYAASNPNGFVNIGEVSLSGLNDVDSSTISAGLNLQYNADNEKFQFTRPIVSTYSAIRTANPVLIDSPTPIIITDMELSPPVGTYLVNFNSQFTVDDTSSQTAQAKADLILLYNQLKALIATGNETVRVPNSLTYGSETLGPGVYIQGGAINITGILTLDAGGDPNALFVFRTGGAFSTAAGAEVRLINGATSNNVYFVSEGAASTAANAIIRGSILANQAAVSTGAGTSLEGRMLAINGAVSLGAASIITAPTGTINSILTLGNVLALFNMFAGSGGVSNTGPSEIQLSIGTDLGAITGFGTATVGGSIIPGGADTLTVFRIAIYVDGIIVQDSLRSTSRPFAAETFEYPVVLQTVLTLTEGQTIDVRAYSELGIQTVGPRTSLILTLVQSGASYTTSNPEGFITNVDLSTYVQNSETGAFYPASNPSGFITGVDLSSYVQDSETGLFLVSGEDASISALQVGSTPAFPYTRTVKLHDDGVQFGARLALIGTTDNGFPGLEMVTDGDISKRTLIRHEGEGSNDYGISFFTTNNGVVAEKVRFDGDGNVGIGTATPAAKLHIAGAAQNSYIEPRVENTAAVGAAGFAFINSNQEWKMGVNTADTFRIRDNDASTNPFVIEAGGAPDDSFHMDSNGNVGIGINSPSAKLHSNGTNDTGYLALFTSNGATPNLSQSDDVKRRAIAVQGEGAAYYIGRDLTNNIEFVMGTSTAGVAFLGSLTNHGVDIRVNNQNALKINTAKDVTIVNGHLNVDSDSKYLKLGASQDAGIIYNGTNMVFDSRLVGTGDFVFANGNVGIGTTTPAAKLDVIGGILANTLGVGGAPDANIDLHVKSDSAKFLVENTLAGGEWVRFSAGTLGSAMKFSNAGTFGIGPVATKTDTSIPTAFSMTSVGDIGMGTTTPSTRLEVVGEITTAGLISSDNIQIEDNTKGLSLMSTTSTRYGLKYGLAGVLGGSDHLMLTNREVSGDILFGTSPGGGGDNEEERMRITSDGNVGIGTTSPDQLLHINRNQNAATNIKIENSNAGVNSSAGMNFHSATADGYYFLHGANRTTSRYGLSLADWVELTHGGSDDLNGIVIGTRTDIPVVIGANNNEIARFTDNGVGIGTASPDELLHLEATAIEGREVLMKATVSDAGNDHFGISNGTSTNNNFAPSFYGYKDSTYGNGYIYSLNFRGLVPDAQDTTQTNRFGIVHFEAFKTNNAADPNNGTFNSLTNRKLFTFSNGGNTVLEIDADNTVTISQDLSVSGDSSFSNRPTVNGTGVLLSGEGGGGTVENVVHTTGDQTISGTKSFGKISLSENSFVTETGSFTIGPTHRGATVLLENSASMTVTIPAQVSGHTTTFIAETSNSVVFATGAGISGFNSFNSANQIAGIYGQAQIIFKSPEYAFLGGNVV